MPFAMEKLAPRERLLVEELMEACSRAEAIFWRQSDPEGAALYEKLPAGKDASDAALRRFLWINGGRWDLLDGNRPFVGREPMPPGHWLYPKDLTRAEIESYVAAHPDERKDIYGERTVIARREGRLAAIPYREAYRDLLTQAATALREAAEFSDGDPAFARFLRMRADALLSDDYYASDVAWLELVDPKFDLILAPYETYMDELLGVKGSFGAAVLVRDDAESEKLAVFRKYVPEIQDSLPLPPEDRPSLRGKAAPMEVVNAPYRSGDLRHGYQAVADNLPNDPRIHEEHGSKRIFFKNFLDARVAEIIIPLARRLLREEDARASARGYLIGTMLHEIAHGLGPAFARVDGKRVSIREAIGPPFSALEEAKADTTGMAALSWLAERKAVPAEQLPECYASFVADLFRTVRFGTAEAHARAEMMEFNFLVSEGAITREPSGRYALHFEKMPAAFSKLSKELLEIEAAGDRKRAEAWFAKYDAMPPDLAASLKSLTDVPVDIDPQVPFPESIR
ncbi:MAG TPA: Zn-dependent hydrolase [Thermoanaerobaculia bacterium]|nr:Zn-dependent hydrolase [Thermoanaerobaculia bacterium]